MPHPFEALQLNKGNLQRLLGSFTTGVVSSFSAGSTGLTPVAPTGGAVTLGGTLNVANGGTGSTTSTGTAASGVVLATSPLIVTPTLVGVSAQSVVVAGPGAASTTISTSTALGATLGVRDTGAAANNGGQVIFGASQGYYAGIKGLIANGSNNTTGLLSFQTRAVNTDSALTERLQLTTTGAIVTGTMSLSGALTYGGVTLANSVTGTGSMVLNTSATIASPTLTSPALGTPVSGVLSNCTGFPGASSATTFLAGDVALNNTGTFFSGPNTGSIGAAGQMWLLMGVAQVTDTGASSAIEVAIFDGTVYICNSVGQNPAASSRCVVTVCAVVTLSAATTFTLRAKDLGATTGVLQTTNSASGVANKATSITAIRLT